MKRVWETSVTSYSVTTKTIKGFLRNLRQRPRAMAYSKRCFPCTHQHPWAEWWVPVIPPLEGGDKHVPGTCSQTSLTKSASSRFNEGISQKIKRRVQEKRYTLSASTCKYPHMYCVFRTNPYTHTHREKRRGKGKPIRGYELWLLLFSLLTTWLSFPYKWECHSHFPWVTEKTLGLTQAGRVVHTVCFVI